MIGTRDDSTWIYKTWFAPVMGDTFAMHDGERHARERARVAPHLVGAPLERDPATGRRSAADEVVDDIPGRRRSTSRPVHSGSGS